MINKPNVPETRPHQTGVSLVEVLVSIFVLTFGLLGIAAMQAGALRNTQGAMDQSAAVFLTHSILDAMRASMQPNTTNPGTLDVLPGYETNLYLEADTDGFICSEDGVPDTNTLVANDLRRWLRDIQSNLSNKDACARIVCDANDPNLCTASVQWNNSRSLGGNEKQVVDTRSRL